MRLILIITTFILFSCSRTSGQTMSDTSQRLVRITTRYLNLMYINHNFNEAAQMWDTTRMKQAFSHVFSVSGKRDTSLNLEKLKERYYNYFNTVSEYSLIGEIKIGEIQKEDSLQRSFITYHYSEKLDGQKNNGEAILILTSKDFGMSWDILDIKVF